MRSTTPNILHTTESIMADKRLDIKGQVCPYTFVRSKLVLEKMNIGEILEIVTDHRPALNDIPKNMEHEGQKVLKIEQSPDEAWHIFIMKNSEKC
jgi:tRNA 2-thiouridine synthesizing protein A